MNPKMTLLDEFAKASMARRDEFNDYADNARESYYEAEAMMKEREKRNKPVSESRFDRACDLLNRIAEFSARLPDDLRNELDQYFKEDR